MFVHCYLEYGREGGGAISNRRSFAWVFVFNIRFFFQQKKQTKKILSEAKNRLNPLDIAKRSEAIFNGKNF